MQECTMNNTTISHDYLFLAIKKSLNIPKGQSESVYLRRTYNTMVKRKRTKGKTTNYKTYI
jgi:hypothetical protein